MYAEKKKSLLFSYLIILALSVPSSQLIQTSTHLEASAYSSTGDLSIVVLPVTQYYSESYPAMRAS
jgi:hypothetical protein